MTARARARSLAIAPALAFAFAFAFTLGPSPVPHARGDAQPAAPDRVARLVGLTEVWLEARVTHPAMLRGTVDLDGAAVAAIPKVEAAKTKQEYAAAIAGMLAVLGDPATRVVDPAAAPPPPAVPVKFFETPEPNLAVVTLVALADPATRASAGMLVATLPQQLLAANVVMFDLRAPGLEDRVKDFVDNAAVALPPVERWSISRSVVHHGFRSQEGVSAGGYDSTYELAPRTVWQRGRPNVAHVVFVADARTPLPAVALALQASGRATIASAEPLTDGPTAQTRDVDLPWGLVARVRAEEVMMADGTAIAADVTIPAGASPHTFGLELAKKLLAGGKPPPRRAGPPVPPALPVMRDDRDWPETALPRREVRMFAAMRAWGLLARFFPYQDLITGWDTRLGPAILAAEAATDPAGYRDALAALGAHLHDGHVSVSTFPPTPRSAPGIELRLVENRPIITAVWDPDLAKLGVRAGDEVVSIDGAPIDQRRAALRPITTGGTPTSRENRILESALAGPAYRKVTVELRGEGAGAKPRVLELPRDRPRPPLAGPHYKLLPGDIGYADLRLLAQGEVDAMFAAFAKARGIIFDLRGYPNGTAWPIAPHINTKGAKLGAQFVQPLVRALADRDDANLGTTFHQRLPQDPAAAVYKGRIAVLIDDRAISQAEHTCLFFEAAAGVTFIGSPTHGSNGDVTMMRLPGRLRMAFTGQAVRHADGRQLQRLGIQPTIPSAPTIAGVRAGRDEVLDRAVGWIQTGR